jgi:hypothetical protein
MERPTSPDTFADLRRLIQDAEGRGDRTMAVLLRGVDLYAGLGREYELLDIMRGFAAEVKDAVHNTPSAEQLRALYEREESD